MFLPADMLADRLEGERIESVEVVSRDAAGIMGLTIRLGDGRLLWLYPSDYEAPILVEEIL